MTDEKAVVPTQKHRPTFTQLPTILVRLVNDRFDEDQYDQAVELLEQLRVEGVRPPKSLIQKLVGLSLCSLAPRQVASTSRWTLDHQLHNIAARLLTQHKGTKSDRDAMKTTSSTPERPSGSAVLRASSLLIQYSRCNALISVDNTRPQSEAERNASLLALHVLESLPSQRRPLESRKSNRSASTQRARLDSERLDDSDHDGSFEVSSIEQWVYDHLQQAEDVWDLLSGRRFSNDSESEEVSLGRVSEFWMNDSERKRYAKQLHAFATAHQRLEDRLRDHRWKKLNGGTDSNSSDSDSDEVSDEDILGLKAKRSVQPNSKRKATCQQKKPDKRERTRKGARLPYNDTGTSHTNVKMTEGGWRTLSVLLELWHRASPQAVGASADSMSRPIDEPPLLWQFPHSHVTSQDDRHPTSKIAAGKDTTDEIGRALDVAFSFPSVLPAYVSCSSGTEASVNLFDTAKSVTACGDARLFSSVSAAELMHRHEVGNQKVERLMAVRAEAAAWLLSSMYELVKLNYISHVALLEGMSDRMEALQAQEIQFIMLPLLAKEAYLVAAVLIRNLTDTTRTRPDKIKALDHSHFLFDGQGIITMDAALAYAIPRHESAITLLQACLMRYQDGNAKAVLQFLSLNRLELDDAADSDLQLTLPNRAESGKQAVVRKQSRRHLKTKPSTRKTGKMMTEMQASEAASTELTEDMMKNGMLAFAFVRTLQMGARNRINQIKFLIARAMSVLHAGNQTSQASPDAGASTNDRNPRPAQDSESKTNKLGEVESASQQRNLEVFLTQLCKALEHDVGDFQSCVAAMKTHVNQDSADRRFKDLAGQLVSGTSDRDAPVSLPSLEALVDRCQKYYDDTQHLAHTTRMLLDSVKWS
ncbi:uncharacterized protein UMAG_02879 [Mycosarcoma maydis]|uniref:Uncharacterized protein n=1 Tax=Mycosarcoma maydis TaxID=5270 RepID=A0A0D1CQM0_MYCMD|nr:uncharacterized protein UMAG_02879 [Ustilago maydis 521]KIS68893.1 hypothetical protein UMAG_02879 [Ustilago maydis 521]|eukprot:XP_011389309.1 hypothetical protein UMAG_02879 [Ustilago maydis 521]